MAWKLKSSKEIYKSKYLTLEQDTVVTNYGDETVYSTVRKDPFAIVIPWDGEKFVIEKLYRFAVDRYSWEFPAGHLQGGSIENTAVNELQEETGLKAEKFVAIGRFYPANGFLDQEGYVFLATNLSFGKTNRDESEKGMEIKKVTPKELEEMIRMGVIKDGPTISAYALLKLSKYWRTTK